MKIECRYDGSTYELEQVAEDGTDHQWAIGYLDGEPCQWSYPSDGMPDRDDVMVYHRQSETTFMCVNEHYWKLENGRWTHSE